MAVLPATHKYNARPPAELIPDDLAKLLAERDRLAAQAADAERHAHDLEGDHHDHRARQADDDAAAAAARAGKALPAPKAVPALADEREAAARQAAALWAALGAVTAEVDTLAGKHYWNGQDVETKRRADAADRIRRQAEKLADALEAEHAHRAAREWLRTGHLARTAPRVDAFAVLPSLRSCAGMLSGRAFADPARTVITLATAAALTEETR